MGLGYFRFYFYAMTIELLFYGRYIYHCLRRKYTYHPLFYASVLCSTILVFELIRCYLILRGDIPATMKSLFWYGLELSPFWFVGYELGKKVYHKITQRLQCLDLEE